MGLRGPKPEKINEDALLCCSPESDYWCGILATDGNVCFGKGRSVPLIRYGAVDIEHVYKFRDFLWSKRKIQLVDRVTGFGPVKYGVFAVSNAVIGEFLIKNGIVPSKSLTLRVSGRLASSPAFWRGVIDGDGTITIAKRYSQPIVCLSSGSFQFIRQFAEFCVTLGLRPKIVDSVLTSFSRAPHYHIALGSGQALQLLNTLYAGATVWLDRKKMKVGQIFAQPICQKYVCKVVEVAGIRVGANVVQ